jgi:hypothetical protein
MATVPTLAALFNRRHCPKTRVLGALVALVLLPLPTGAQNGRAPKKTEVAPGIFVFSAPPYGDVGLDGNSIVILSNDGVLVFDSNGTPAASAAVLAEIRGMAPRSRSTSRVSSASCRPTLSRSKRDWRPLTTRS